jgi:hypothetical protein
LAGDEDIVEGRIVSDSEVHSVHRKFEALYFAPSNSGGPFWPVLPEPGKWAGHQFELSLGLASAIISFLGPLVYRGTGGSARDRAVIDVPEWPISASKSSRGRTRSL